MEMENESEAKKENVQDIYKIHIYICLISKNILE